MQKITLGNGRPALRGFKGFSDKNFIGLADQLQIYLDKLASEQEVLDSNVSFFIRTQKDGSQRAEAVLVYTIRDKSLTSRVYNAAGQL